MSAEDPKESFEKKFVAPNRILDIERERDTTIDLINGKRSHDMAEIKDDGSDPASNKQRAEINKLADKKIEQAKAEAAQQIAALLAPDPRYTAQGFAEEAKKKAHEEIEKAGAKNSAEPSQDPAQKIPKKLESWEL